MLEARVSLLATVLLLTACGDNSGDAGSDDVGEESGTDTTTDTGSTGTDTGTDAGTDTGETTDTGGEELPFDYCEGAPPDDECYAAKRDPDSEAVAMAMALADRHMENFPATEQTWDWEEAVFMFSLTELYRVTGEARFLDHAQAWVDFHIDNGYLIETSDTCAPVATAAELYRVTDDPKYAAVFDDALAYFDAAARSNDGGLSHFGTFPLAPTLWADSLFMFGNVLTRWGELRDDPAQFEELELQFSVFTDKLQSPGGLYAHAWNFPTADPDIYWGRGNGWVTASGYDYLRALRIREQEDPALAAALDAQVAAIIANQDPSGLWWIVVDRPDEIYLETSTTALFAYGMARAFRYGYLEGELVLPVIEDAMAAVDGKIVVDGEGKPYVTEISGPTGPGDMANYAGIPLEDDLGYGVGAVILALIESSGLPPA